MRWSNPNEAVFYTSGRTSNEAAFLYQLLVRSFGTNNLPDCSNMCHESSGTALIDAIGVGKGSVTVEDLTHGRPDHHRRAESRHQPSAHVVRVGEGEGQRRQDHCGQSAPEAGLIRFKDPQKVHGVVGRGIPIADEFVQIRLGGDMALFAGLGRLLLEADDAAPGTVVDRAFIDAHCANFAEYEARTRAIDIDTVLEATGIDRAQLDKVAWMLMASQRTVVCWAMGLTQHRHAVAMISEISNVLLMRGMIGKPGAGLCPVRGHSNVQGDRTMGIWEKMPEKFLAALDARFGIVEPARARRRHRRCDPRDARRSREGVHGHGRQLRLGDTGHRGDGGGAAQLLADGAGVDEAQSQPRRTWHDGADPAVTGPHRPRSPERRQTAGVGRGFDVDRASVARQPASAQRRSAQRGRDRLRLARTLLGPRHPVPWEQFIGDYDTIRDAIAAVVPGCDDYNRKVRRPDGFQLPHPPRDSREFPTSTGKANFSAYPLEWVPVPDGRLVLQTLRSHDQYNTTIYGLDDRYRGVKGGRRVVFVEPGRHRDVRPRPTATVST